jgi:hypothetical protein
MPVIAAIAHAPVNPYMSCSRFPVIALTLLNSIGRLEHATDRLRASRIGGTALDEVTGLYSRKGGPDHNVRRPLSGRDEARGGDLRVVVDFCRVEDGDLGFSMRSHETPDDRSVNDFVVDLYRVMEHATDRLRASRIGGTALDEVTGLYSRKGGPDDDVSRCALNACNRGDRARTSKPIHVLLEIPRHRVEKGGPDHNEVLSVVARLYGNLPIEFKRVNAMTGNLEPIHVLLEIPRHRVDSLELDREIAVQSCDDAQHFVVGSGRVGSEARPSTR